MVLASQALDTKDEAERCLHKHCEFDSKLYPCPYAARLRLARFLSELYELTEVEDGPGPSQREPLSAEAIAAIRVEVDSETATLHLPERITQPVVADLLQYFESGGRLHHKDVLTILEAAKDAMRDAPTVTRIPSGSAVVTVVGDLHGSFNDLHEILTTIGQPSSENVVLFNGDFVDRGPNGLEVLLVILALKVPRA